MELQPKKSVSLSSVTFFSGILVGAMGWVVTLTLLQGHEAGITKEVIEIGKEVLKVAVIAAAAAIAVERFLNTTLDHDPRQEMSSVGLQAIHRRRLEASEAFLNSVRNENIHHITICGISAREFLIVGGSLFEVWREIRQRLTREQAANLPDSRRLHVRLLLLLPHSDEGYFRHSVESRNKDDVGGLPFDIPTAVGSVQAAQQDIFGNSEALFLQIRLYEHCPFSFMFVTDTEVFVEQYDYRDQEQPSAMPVLCYKGGTAQYKELMFSLEVIWNHAREAEHFREVGTAAAIREARVENIFRSQQKAALTAKQVQSVQGATGGSIDIQAITGKFYVSNPYIANELRRISLSEGIPGIPIRFLIVNPVSQQAIMRAIADSSPPAQVGEELRNWDWSRHIQSDLYKDARSTAHALYNWGSKNGKYKFVCIQVLSLA